MFNKKIVACKLDESLRYVRECLELAEETLRRGDVYFYVVEFPNKAVLPWIDADKENPKTLLGRMLFGKKAMLSSRTSYEVDAYKTEIIPGQQKQAYQVKFSGFVQERVFRGTIQNIARALDESITIDSVENIKEGPDKGKVLAQITASESQLKALINMLRIPHIIAHVRTGEGNSAYGPFLIMSLEERSILLTIEPGYIFINMVTDVEIK
jgi:hypothetical protein